MTGLDWYSSPRNCKSERTIEEKFSPSWRIDRKRKARKKKPRQHPNCENIHDEVPFFIFHFFAAKEQRKNQRRNGGINSKNTRNSRSSPLYCVVLTLQERGSSKFAQHSRFSNNSGTRLEYFKEEIRTLFKAVEEMKKFFQEDVNKCISFVFWLFVLWVVCFYWWMKTSFQNERISLLNKSILFHVFQIFRKTIATSSIFSLERDVLQVISDILVRRGILEIIGKLQKAIPLAPIASMFSLDSSIFAYTSRNFRACTKSFLLMQNCSVKI